jgi:hypothetical protein
VGLDCAKELPTDSGTVEMAAIANAKASVILINMIILLVLKPNVAPADQIAQQDIYFRARIRMGFGQYKSSCAL